MKTKYLLSVLCMAILLALSCNKDDDPAPEAPIFSKLEHKTFTSNALANNAIGNTTQRDMVVYTPPGYNPAGIVDYPVIYLLHGLPFTDSAYISQQKWDPWIDPNGFFKTYPDFPAQGFKNWVDDMIESGQIDPMIIVMPDAANAMYGFCFYTNSILNGNFEDYIAEDIVNYIDNNYQTITNKSGRALIGHSQGGYGAIKLGMKHSDKFSVVAAHSAPLFFDGFAALTHVLLAENPTGFTGPDPAKFLTSGIYAMSAAWSPNLNNPPFMVDLPFEYPSGNTIESVWSRWLEHDPFTMLDTYEANFRSLQGIYFDAGDMDPLGSNLTSDVFHQKLDAMHIPHSFEIYSGEHFDKSFERLAVSLTFCSGAMHQ